MIGLGEILTGINILDRLGKFWNWLRAKKNPSAESITTRFIRLFESHGVHRNQIPRFFGHGLTLKDVQDDASLLAKLDEPLLEAACTLFSVRREWLDGADSQVHPCHDFYKHPEEFSRFLDNLLSNNPDGQIMGVLLAPEITSRNYEALLILQETIGTIGDKPVYRYHLCNNWDFTYWKSRAYLTACVAIAWKRNVYIHGLLVPVRDVEQISQGNLLLGWQGEGVWGLGVRKWYAEDMALRPDTFLKGLDPEQDNFGIKSGLKLWLHLEQEGFMDSGFGENPRQAFQNELTKYLSTTGI
jgi:hypothetical protein